MILNIKADKMSKGFYVAYQKYTKGNMGNIFLMVCSMSKSIRPQGEIETDEDRIQADDNWNTKEDKFKNKMRNRLENEIELVSSDRYTTTIEL